MKNLKNISLKVKHILENYKKTRDSDSNLIKWLFFIHYNVDPQESFDSVLSRVISGELPCFESIRRTRQKIQENGELTATSNVRAFRKGLENDVKKQIKEW